MARVTERARQAAQVGSLILVPVLGVIVSFATELRDNAFLWALAATLTLASVGLFQVSRGQPPWPRSRPLTVVLATLVLIALTGSAAHDLTRPPEALCAPRETIESDMGGRDPRMRTKPPVVYICPSHGNFNVYKTPDSALIVGRMTPATEVWVICHKRGRGARIWYYTQGDDTRAEPGLQAWGYIRHWGLRIPVHPDPAVPACPRSTP